MFKTGGIGQTPSLIECYLAFISIYLVLFLFYVFAYIYMCVSSHFEYFVFASARNPLAIRAPVNSIHLQHETLQSTSYTCSMKHSSRHHTPAAWNTPVNIIHLQHETLQSTSYTCSMKHSSQHRTPAAWNTAVNSTLSHCTFTLTSNTVGLTGCPTMHR